MKTLADRVRHIRTVLSKEQNRGVTQVELARIAGKSKQVVSQWEDGTVKSLKLDTALRLQQATGFRAEWISSGKPPERVREEALEARARYGPQIAVPVFNVGSVMGKSAHRTERDTVVDQLQLSSAWVNSHLTISSAQNLAVLTAYGDSMLPTFNDGDILLVDRGVVDLKIDAIYVIDLRNELYIKRIQRRPDGLYLMKSDNPLYDPYLLNKDDMQRMRVLGRIIWAWNGKKL